MSEGASSQNGALIGEVMKFLAQDGWPTTLVEGPGIVRTDFEGDNGKWMCYAQVDEAARLFAFYSLCPVKVPESKRRAMAEFITRANFGLVLGNLEMDFRDGEIRCKTSLDLSEGELTAGLLRPLVYTNVAIMDNYLPGIMAVASAVISPEEAIARIEAKAAEGEED